MTTERVENMAGGQGHALIKRLLDEKQLNGKCRLYAEVTLEPGCSLGYHEHHNESETYYILSEGNLQRQWNTPHGKCRRCDLYTGRPGTWPYKQRR